MGRVSVPMVTVLGLVAAGLIWVLPRDYQWAAHWAWLPGTVLGVIAGAYGSTAWRLAQQGRGRQAVLAVGSALVAVSAGILLGGLGRLVAGMPMHAWYPWVLTGGLGAGLLGANLPRVARVYQEIEMRKLESADIAGA